MMNGVAAFLWSLLTVYLAGAIVFLDPLWIVEIGMVGRIVAVVLWLLLFAALSAAGRRKGWGLEYAIGLAGSTVLIYAVGGVITLEPLWFHDINAWWRMISVAGIGFAAVAASEGIELFG